MPKSDRLFPDKTTCYSCGAEISETGDYCGHCGAPLTNHAMTEKLMEIYQLAIRFPRIILIADNNIREMFEKLASSSKEKHRLSKPSDFPELFPQATPIKTDSPIDINCLPEILQELKAINAKLGPTPAAPEPDAEPPKKKRGRPKKNP